MARLTLALKKAIVENAVIQAGIPEAKAEAVRRRAELAEHVRVHGLGGEEKAASIAIAAEALTTGQEELKKLVSVNSFSLHRDYDVDAAFNGRQIDLHFNGTQEYHDSKDRIFKSPVPRGRVLFNADHELTKEFDAILDLELATKAQEELVELTVKGVIYPIGTVEKLLEAWPDADALLPLEERRSGLPAIAIADLNKMVKLPKKGKSNES